MYIDIPETHHDYDAIVLVSKLFLMSGYADGSFQPGNSVTWAEMFKIIYVFLEGDKVYNNEENHPYDGRNKYHWAESFINYCKDKNIIADSNMASMDLTSHIAFKDVCELFCRATQHKKLLTIPKQTLSIRGDATRLDVAKLIYDICKCTGPIVSEKVISYNNESNWHDSLILLSHYKFCFQFIDADIAHIFDLLDKFQAREKEYEYMIRILDCKKCILPCISCETIYHYTSIYTLEKLTQPDAKLRLNNVAYMNDPTEGLLLKQLIKDSFSEKELLTWRFLNEQDNEIPVSHSFVASFSKKGDEFLPMWIQYGDNAAGCMLGIRTSSINLPLYEVIYNEKIINDYLNKVKGVLLEYQKRCSVSDLNNDIVYSYAAEVLTQISYLYKDKYYEHESEVRILSFANLSFAKKEPREGEYFPRLFIELDDTLQFDSITLGPKATSIEKIAVALSERGYNKINKSKIPFR